MKFSVIGINDLGLVRRNNEDKILMPGFLFADGFHEATIISDTVEVFAVADGMGGHKGGEVASGFVLEHLKAFVSNLVKGLSYSRLKHEFDTWIQDTHVLLHIMGKEKPELFRMGTTLTGLVYYYGGLYWFNAGDSRIYHIRGELISQISSDHTLANITNNPEIPSNILANSVGGGDTVFLDMGDLCEKSLPGDSYLICSDGLYDMVDEISIGHFAGHFKIAELVELAKRNGGRDNISALCIRLH